MNVTSFKTFFHFLIIFLFSFSNIPPPNSTYVSINITALTFLIVSVCIAYLFSTNFLLRLFFSRHHTAVYSIYFISILVTYVSINKFNKCKLLWLIIYLDVFLLSLLCFLFTLLFLCFSLIWVLVLFPWRLDCFLHTHLCFYDCVKVTDCISMFL